MQEGTDKMKPIIMIIALLSASTTFADIVIDTDVVSLPQPGLDNDGYVCVSTMFIDSGEEVDDWDGTFACTANTTKYHYFINVAPVFDDEQEWQLQHVLECDSQQVLSDFQVLFNMTNGPDIEKEDSDSGTHSCFCT